MPSLSLVDEELTQTRMSSPASSEASMSPTVLAEIVRSVVRSCNVPVSKTVAPVAPSVVTESWSIGATASSG